MPEGVAICVLLSALVIGLMVGTLIGAVFLRAAVVLYNNLAGGASSPSSVPEPTFGKAMWISFAICVAQMVVGLFIGGVTGTEATAAGASAKGVDVALLISIPVSLLIQAAILSEKLPTTFARAILVTLCDLLIVLLVVGVLVVIAVLVFGVVLRGT
jgi:hypothetical protein